MTRIILLIAALFLPPCASEDSATCYWDAAHVGNGRGLSFIDIDGAIVWREAARQWSAHRSRVQQGDANG